MSYSTDYDQFPWICVTCCNCSDYWPNTQLPVQMLVLDCQRHNGTIVISEQNCKRENDVRCVVQRFKSGVSVKQSQERVKTCKKLVFIPPHANHRCNSVIFRNCKLHSKDIHQMVRLTNDQGLRSGQSEPALYK